jgi:hypothetical protein
MARYIKANSKVAEYLKLENDRNKVTDGNYLLWQADMLAFGRLTELPQILEQIGGLALQAHEAREEQDGTVVRKLPTATDPRFVVEEATEQQPGNIDTPTDVPEAGTDTEAGEEPAPEPEPESPEDGQGETTEQPVTEEPGKVTNPEPTPTDGQATASEETGTADPAPEVTEETDQTEADTGDDEARTETTIKEETEA